MKKFIWIIGWVVVLGLLGFGIYKFFIDCEKVNTYFDRYFTLDEMDYAVVEDAVTVKLLDIKDDRCLEESCEREGQFLVRLVVLNDAKFAYVELGTLEPVSVKLDEISLEYTLNLIRVDDSGATLTVTPNEEEE